MASLVLFLASCTIGNEPDNTQTNKNTIYAPGSDVSIVVPEGSDYDAVLDVLNEIYAKAEVLCSMRYDSVAAQDNEIVFGDTSREISQRAKQALNSAIQKEAAVWESEGRDTDYLLGYTVHAEGNSVAIVWSNDLVYANAVDYFVENYLTGDSLKIEDDYYKTVTFDYIECLREGIFEMNDMLNAKETALLQVYKQYGREVEQALRDHLSIINERYYLWLADLYVPRKCICENFDAEGNRICLLPRDENGKCLCTGGGFYYSNSARDTEGYEIDIESTVQAIRFLHNSGMLEDYNGSYKKALPKQMQKDICAFAKSLQDSEDGYFYHPQWGKDIRTSRQSRDLGWATSILKDLGDMPLYDTKNGYKGSLGAPSGVTNNEDGSQDNSTWITQLQSLDNFEKYLEEFDLKTRSYHCGNEINALRSQIIARDNQAMLDGEAHDYNSDGIADDGFIAMLELYFNARQNPENGLWQEDISYYSLSGLMKIVSSYNDLGIKFNYAEEAFASAIRVALIAADEADCNGKMAISSTDVYNPWVAMSDLLINTKKFGTDKEYEMLRDMFEANLVELIGATTHKTKKFMKEDGSFGYTWGSPPYTSQGASVCPPGIVEGDVNGGNIASAGIFRTMCAALGIKVPIFSGDDFIAFIDRIKENCGYK